jgi:hypothetical protein
MSGGKKSAWKSQAVGLASIGNQSEAIDLGFFFRQTKQRSPKAGSLASPSQWTS